MSKPEHPSLKKIVTARMNRPVPDAVSAISDAARAQHGDAVLAVLAYGSCLRGTDIEDSLIDLYLVVSDYRSAISNVVSATFNRLIPPNVYYLECPFKNKALRAKYAVISLSQFKTKTGRATENPYFWARFAQPTALVWTKDKTIPPQIADVFAQSIESLLEKAAPLAQGSSDARTLWSSALTQTYRTEFRSEAVSRTDVIIDADLTYYTKTAQALYGKDLEDAPIGAVNPAKSQWAKRRLNGKLLSLLRLTKAAFTFQGGADYIAWKIERHSGVKVDLSDWQRRHPIIAGLLLMPKLLSKGAIR